MKKEIIEYKFTELENAYSLDKSNQESLLLGITSDNTEPYSLTPTFNKSIKRYCWVPKTKDDILNIDILTQDETEVFLNNKLITTNKFKIFSKYGPMEYVLKIQKQKEIETYCIVTLPINFPPLNIKIENPDKVSDGNIYTSVFIVPKLFHWPLIIKDVINYFPESKKNYLQFLFQNIRTRIKIPTIVKEQTEQKLEKSRRYLPYIMMLDKFGVPIWYKMAGIGFSAFRPYKNGYYYGAVSNYPQFAIGLGKTVLLD